MEAEILREPWEDLEVPPGERKELLTRPPGNAKTVNAGGLFD